MYGYMRMEQLTIIKYSRTYKLAVCMSWRERERGRGQRKEGRKEIRKKGRHTEKEGKCKEGRKE